MTFAFRFPIENGNPRQMVVVREKNGANTSENWQHDDVSYKNRLRLGNDINPVSFLCL